MKNKQLAAIRIGIETFILPMSDGLKLVDIMSRALAAEPLYQGRKKFRLDRRDDLRRIDLQLIRHDEIDIDEPVGAKPLQIAFRAEGGTR